MFFQNTFLLLFLEDRDMLCSQICPGEPISKPNMATQTTKNCLPPPPTSQKGKLLDGKHCSELKTNLLSLTKALLFERFLLKMVSTFSAIGYQSSLICFNLQKIVISLFSHFCCLSLPNAFSWPCMANMSPILCADIFQLSESWDEISL